MVWAFSLPVRVLDSPLKRGGNQAEFRKGPGVRILHIRDWIHDSFPSYCSCQTGGSLVTLVTMTATLKWAFMRAVHRYSRDSGSFSRHIVGPHLFPPTLWVRGACRTCFSQFNVLGGYVWSSWRGCGSQAFNPGLGDLHTSRSWSLDHPGAWEANGTQADSWWPRKRNKSVWH